MSAAAAAAAGARLYVRNDPRFGAASAAAAAAVQQARQYPIVEKLIGLFHLAYEQGVDIPTVFTEIAGDGLVTYTSQDDIRDLTADIRESTSYMVAPTPPGGRQTYDSIKYALVAMIAMANDAKIDTRKVYDIVSGIWWPPAGAGASGAMPTWLGAAAPAGGFGGLVGAGSGGLGGADDSGLSGGGLGGAGGGKEGDDEGDDENADTLLEEAARVVAGAGAAAATEHNRQKKEGARLEAAARTARAAAAAASAATAEIGAGARRAATAAAAAGLAAMGGAGGAPVPENFPPNALRFFNESAKTASDYVYPKLERYGEGTSSLINKVINNNKSNLGEEPEQYTSEERRKIARLLSKLLNNYLIEGTGGLNTGKFNPTLSSAVIRDIEKYIKNAIILLTYIQSQRGGSRRTRRRRGHRSTKTRRQH